jgi:hypothetical protein
MKDLAKIEAQQLNWTQTQPFSTHYNLSEAQICLARMAVGFDHTRYTAQAQFVAGEWFFQYTRFVRPIVIVRRIESNLSEGIFESSWLGEGVFRHVNGLNYMWINSDPWTKVWKSRDHDEDEVGNDKPLATFTWKPGWLRKSAQVRLDAIALQLEELPILLSLGMFLMLIPKQVRRLELIPGAKRA